MLLSYPSNNFCLLSYSQVENLLFLLIEWFHLNLIQTTVNRFIQDDLKGVLNNVIHIVWNEVLIIKRRELENPQRLNNGNSGLNNLTKEITEFDTSTYALQCAHYLIYKI